MQTANQEQMHDDDEIDLRDLVRTLIKRKKVILLVTLFTLVGALAYALLSTPVYKATATFLPPTESDTAHLVVPDIYKPDQSELYRRFAITLESRKVYWEAFNSLNLLDYYQGNETNSEVANKAIVFDRFIKNLSLARPQSKKGEDITPNLFLSTQDKSPEMAAKITNTISDFANSMLAREVIDDINERITLQKIELEKNIGDLRVTIGKNNLDEVEKIKESDALKIKELNDQITELKNTHQKQTLDEIEKLKENDALKIKDINDQIAELKNTHQKQILDEIEKLKENDILKIKDINDQITELKNTHQKQILDEIEKLKENDALKTKEIRDNLKELRAIAKGKRMDEIEQLKEADNLATQEIIERIATLKKNAAIVRNDRIAILSEAANIAKKSGIIERSNTSSNKPNPDKTTIYTEINTQAQPLYLRGEKELRAEMFELQSREYDDPFIPGLRELQQELDLLKDNKKIKSLLSRKNDDPFIPEIRALQEQLILLKTNRKIEILLARKNSDPFIPGLRELQEQIELLKNNRQIDILLARKNSDPFIPGLRELQEQIELLKDNRQIDILLARKNSDPFIPGLRELQEQIELLKDNRRIEILLSRKNNDPFIESLRTQEIQLAELNSIQLEPGKVRLASFDQPAFPPTKRIKPKRSLIVALGAVLGLFLGIIAAFLLNFWEGMREEDQQLAKSTK